MKRKPPDPRECGKSETGRSSDCSACYHSAELQIAQCSQRVVFVQTILGKNENAVTMMSYETQILLNRAVNKQNY